MCYPSCSVCGLPLVKKYFTPMNIAEQHSPADHTYIECGDGGRGMMLCEHCVVDYAAKYTGPLPSMLRALLCADPIERHGKRYGKTPYNLPAEQFTPLRKYLEECHTKTAETRALLEKGAAEATEHLKERMDEETAAAVARILGRDAIGKNDATLLVMLAPTLDRVSMRKIVKRARTN